jgi:hypothetical protein
MDEKFKIKSYGFGELALFYFPNNKKRSASTQFGRWIRQNELLFRQLGESGFKLGKKILTPSQVKLIVDFFGEP